MIADVLARFNGNDFTDVAVQHVLLDRLIEIRVAKHVPDNDLVFMLSRDFHQAVHFVFVDGERLFEQ